jgi:hypothetical protein
LWFLLLARFWSQRIWAYVSAVGTTVEKVKHVAALLLRWPCNI